MKGSDYLNFSRALVVRFRASRYVIHLNQTSVWKLMTIRISRKLPLFNFERLDELCPRIGHLCEKLWPFEFLESFCCSISSALIYYIRELDICVKSNDHSNFSRASAIQFWASRYTMPRIGHPSEIYEHSNFSRASIVQFQASRWVMSTNRTSEWKVMTIWISRVLPLFNF